MDLPALSADANASLRRARTVGSERGLARAELSDILVALMDDTGVVRLIELFEVEPDKIRTATTFRTQGPTWLTDADAEERTVDLARTEATRLGQDEAGSEHLLLALLRQSNSVPGGILESLGMNLDSAREAVRYLNGQVPDWQQPHGETSAFAIAPLTAMEFDPDGPHHEDAVRMLEASMGLVEVGMSPLEQVVGIGQVAEASDVLVEMISLEIREAGAMLHWRARTTEEGFLGDADVAISDDIGTVYYVLPASSTGSGLASSGEMIVTPHRRQRHDGSSSTCAHSARATGRSGSPPCEARRWSARGASRSNSDRSYRGSSQRATAFGRCSDQATNIGRLRPRMVDPSTDRHLKPLISRVGDRVPSSDGRCVDHAQRPGARPQRARIYSATSIQSAYSLCIQHA